MFADAWDLPSVVYRPRPDSPVLFSSTVPPLFPPASSKVLKAPGKDDADGRVVDLANSEREGRTP